MMGHCLRPPRGPAGGPGRRQRPWAMSISPPRDSPTPSPTPERMIQAWVLPPALHGLNSQRHPGRGEPVLADSLPMAFPDSCEYVHGVECDGGRSGSVKGAIGGGVPSPKGALVGLVEAVGGVAKHKSERFNGPHGFVLDVPACRDACISNPARDIRNSSDHGLAKEEDKGGRR